MRSWRSGASSRSDGIRETEGKFTVRAQALSERDWKERVIQRPYAHLGHELRNNAQVRGTDVLFTI